MPGPDRISAKVIKVFAEQRLHIYLRMMNGFLQSAAIEKPKKDNDEVMSPALIGQTSGTAYAHSFKPLKGKKVLHYSPKGRHGNMAGIKERSYSAK